ncbi:MAG: hypothetical protein IJX76_04995 [Clostridia bacterium]|nr:hypothetical protein [Clostridia bacterium]
MTKPNDLIAELRRTADQMQSLGDITKADLLTRAADYIEEKRIQQDELPPASANFCVCCGAIIPEGRQICKACEADFTKV